MVYGGGHGGNWRPVEHVVRAVHGWLCEGHIREIPLEELDARDVIEIAPLARDQTVGDTDAVPAADEFFRQVRSDEPGAAGDEVEGHTLQLSNKLTRAVYHQVISACAASSP